LAISAKHFVWLYVSRWNLGRRRVEKKEKDLIKKILIYATPFILMGVFALANYIKMTSEREKERALLNQK
jgi:hypothetical protein